MRDINQSEQIAIAASQLVTERDYWLNKLSGERELSRFPYDNNQPVLDERESPGVIASGITGDLFEMIMKLNGGSLQRLHMILVTAVMILLKKYSRNSDIIIVSPIYRQEVEGEFLNTVLLLRNRVSEHFTFKELLLQVRKTIVEAAENQNYPLERLLEQLGTAGGAVWERAAALFDTAVLLENIHDRRYLRDVRPGIIFSFSRCKDSIEVSMEYDSRRYEKTTARRIVRHLETLLKECCTHINLTVEQINIISKEEKEQILYNFNNTGAEPPGADKQEKLLNRCFEEQVERSPHHTAVTFGNHHLTYVGLNLKSNQLAKLLRRKGIKPDCIVGVMMERSLEMIAALLGVLKAGGAYLPLDPDYPSERIDYMLKDSQVSILITQPAILRRHSFTALQEMGRRSIKAKPWVTAHQPQVKDLDALSFPDRSLVDYEKYHHFIGQVMVKNSISLQATRGCPYNCAYCHKIWPRTHVSRSAENILSEILFYYQLGVRRFSFVDDIFNLNIENSRRFFQLILDKGLKVQLYFPNGMRGDILTREYIDLMIEAGTVNLALALETASPRLQKMIGKNLDLEKLDENIQYICSAHPHLILELFTMHGFPSETREEASMTLDFIKNIRWVHFPYVNILKIFPHSDMEQIAHEHGVSPGSIARSFRLAAHELPETLPFDKTFTLEFQAQFFNDYFLSKDRLLQVLPNQMKILTEDEIIQKYNSYLPVDIYSFEHLLEFVKVDRQELAVKEPVNEEEYRVPGFNEKLRQGITIKEPASNALRILLLDLSQFFSWESQQVYDVVEPPLGLMYLMTFLNEKFGSRIHGKIAKSRIDFDSYQELKVLLKEFKPEVIGIRTLSFFSDFFHACAALVRQWCEEGVIIAGGPHATCSYDIILQDRNVDLVVLGEGEITFAEIIQNIMETGGKLPGDEVLREINGIAFIPRSGLEKKINRDIFILDIPVWEDELIYKNPEHIGKSGDLAYVIFTSGSTGSPKPVGVEHKGVVNMLLDRRNQYQMNPTFTTLLLFPYIFDGFVTSFFTPIISGAKVILPKDDEIADISRIKEIIARHKVTHFISIPGFYKLIIENLNKSESAALKIVTLAGDKISPAILKITKETNANIEIVNEYGVTECSVLSTIYKHQEKNNTIMIGKPTTNTRIYIVGHDRILPIGVPGEMCIAGVGLARGYLNNSELTSEKFIYYKLQNTNYKQITNYNVQNYKTNGIHEFMQSCNHASRQYHSPSPQHPITPIAHSPIYRTGDLARWLNDGNIEFLGRVDEQVKIRGFRIELGEIESRLLAHNDITEAVVISLENKEGEKYLCAYYVAVGASSDSIGAGPTAADLIEYLSRHLPYYMIPSYFMPLGKIPVTPNGKIDRRALPEPEIKGGENYMAPRNAAEEKLAEIWSEILSLEKSVIGIEDNFFHLGGHSLTATIMADKAHKAFNIRLPLAEIFKSPTISGIAAYIKSAEQKTFVSIAAVEKKEYYPLSSQQKRLYILQQMELQSTAYNIPQFVPLDKDIHIENLEVAFNKLIGRHESLRTYFVMTRESPFQKILDHDHVEFQIEYYDIPEVEAEVKAHHPLSEFIQPFDLGNAPLLRMGLIKTLEGKQVLFIDMHHIINDGTSQLVLNREFTALFNGNELPVLKLQYKDYSQWQNSENQKESLKQHEIYWLDTFKGELPVLKLPTDHPRPLIQQFEGYSLSFTLNEKESRNLKDIGNNRDTTLFMTLLSVYTILLSKLSGQEDIIVGTPIAGRRHADLEHIIGMFVNTLALRNYPSAEKSVTEFLSEVREQTLKAFENQEYQFEDLVEKVSVQRDTSRNPVFDVMFHMLNLEEYQGNKAKSGESQKQSLYRHVKEVSKFDMTLTSVDLGAKLFFTLQFSTNLFESGTIERFISYFKKIAAEVANSPGIPISQIEIISQAEKNQILIDFNDTGTEYPSDRTIHEFFAGQVERRPDSIAVIGAKHVDPTQERALTYRALNEKSNHLAGQLKKRGIKPETITAIITERSIEMIIGILGILKAGGAYLPVNPEDPQERIDYMLADSGCNLLLTQKRFIDTAASTAGTSKIIDLEDAMLYAGDCKKLKKTNSKEKLGALAYIIYTSGTTGKPKGVLLEHRSVINTLLVLNETYPFEESDVYLLKTSYMFDVSVTELFGWFYGGGMLAVLEKHDEKDPNEILAAIETFGVTHINFVPSMFNVFVNTLGRGNIGKLSSLKYIFLAGESLLPDPVKKLKALNSEIVLENLYGPTEAAVYASRYSLSNWDSRGNIPIGKPLPNVELYVLDMYGHLQPIGAAGELCISGCGVARGYLNRPTLTAEKFERAVISRASLVIRSSLKTNDQWPMANDRFYKTGDLARWLTDGNIEFLGRLDHQVKIRGFRIELAEIECRLLKHPGINEAVVLPQKGENKFLSAYIVANKELTSLELREYLSRRLPVYMIPSYFFLLDKIPLNANGKVDSSALHSYQRKLDTGDRYAVPGSEIEKVMASTWATVLKLDKVGINDNFFDLGGNSFAIVRLNIILKRILNIEIPVVKLFEYPTIRSLSRYLFLGEKYQNIPGIEEENTDNNITEIGNLMTETVQLFEEIE